MSTKRYIPTPNPANCAYYDDNSGECRNCKNKSIDITTTLILQECVAFYDVFKNLEKRLDHSGIVEESTDNPRQPTLLSVPYIVNGAFSCELALKYILIKNQIDFCISSKGHKLEYLFNLLPQAEKQTLQNLLKNAGNIDDDSLKENILLLSDSFNQWRYYFANIDNGLTYNSFFSVFVNQLCNYVLS